MYVYLVLQRLIYSAAEPMLTEHMHCIDHTTGRTAGGFHAHFPIFGEAITLIATELTGSSDSDNESGNEVADGYCVISHGCQLVALAKFGIYLAIYVVYGRYSQCWIAQPFPISVRTRLLRADGLCKAENVLCTTAVSTKSGFVSCAGGCQTLVVVIKWP